MFKALRQLINFTKPKSSALLSKASDSNLQAALVECLIKSVKTASANAGKDSNIALKDFANQTTGSEHAAQNGATNSILGNTEPLVNDALSHHISQYHAERQAGNHDVANKHLSTAMKYMALGHKSSGGDESKFFAPSAKPWEQTYAKGQAVNFARNISATGSRGKVFPNHNYLENAPNEKHKALFEGHKDNSYPWHHVKVGGKHLDISNDTEANGKFTEHPLDSHPIMSRLGTLTDSPENIENANQRQTPMFYAGVKHIPTEAVSQYHKKSIDWVNDNLNYLNDSSIKHSDENHGLEEPGRLHDINTHQSNAVRNIIAANKPEQSESAATAGVKPTQEVKVKKPAESLEAKPAKSPEVIASKKNEDKEAEKHIQMLRNMPAKIKELMGDRIQKQVENDFGHTDAYKKYLSEGK